MRPIEPRIFAALTLALAALAAATPCGAASFAYIRANVIGSFEEDIVVVDTSTNAVVATIPVCGEGDTYAVAIDPQGEYVYVSCATFDVHGDPHGTISVIKARTNTVIGDYPGIAAWPISLALDPGGQRLFVLDFVNWGSLDSPTFVSVVDTATMSKVDSFSVGYWGVDIAVDHAGKYLHSTHTHEILGAPPCLRFDVPVLYCDAPLWSTDLSNYSSGRFVPVGDYLSRILIAPDDSRAYIVNIGILTDEAGGPIRPTERVSIVGLPPHLSQSNINFPETGVDDIALNPSGTRLYVSAGNKLMMIDTSTETVIGSLAGHGGLMDVTPDGRRLYSAGVERIDVLDADDLHLVTSIPMPGRVLGGKSRFIGPDVPITPPLTATFTETPTPTPSFTATSTPTQTPTPANTGTRTPSRTRTPTRTRTPSGSPAATATPQPTATPTPTQKSTFPGDADCNSVLDGHDVAATITASYDPTSRARCDADCNRDGEVNGADLVCDIRALAGS